VSISAKQIVPYIADFHGTSTPLTTGRTAPTQNTYCDWLLNGARSRIAFSRQIVLSVAGFRLVPHPAPKFYSFPQIGGRVAKMLTAHRSLCRSIAYLLVCNGGRKKR